MQIATVGTLAITLGWLIALVVFILVIIFFVLGQLPPLLAGLLAALAVARLL